MPDSDTYIQADRPLRVTTPLGADKLLLVELRGAEALSSLFRFELGLIAKNSSKIAFDQLLGKKVTAHIRAPGDKTRHICGICSAVSQGGRDVTFTGYRLEVVPELWFLTRRTQSRIFQGKTVPQILEQVLKGLTFELKCTGKYEPRDYCVQYRETDFAFASRLMEDEGIFYFFKHGDGQHTLVVADSPDAFSNVPFAPEATFSALDDTMVDEDRVTAWEKRQELRSGKVTLWDHCFEKPHEHLEAEQQIQGSVPVGSESHALKIGTAEKLELYDWPGGYAGRFDGVGPGREGRDSDVAKIFQDNKRTAKIRMEQEAVQALAIDGESRLRQLTAGHRFKLKEHFNADGLYLLTSVTHQARMTSNYRSGEWDGSFYTNTFRCIPSELPFRPQQVTPRPVVRGTQTAVVVGPKGEELFTDKYGRVKVQFHWDREGKNDERSSCWIRVSQPIAGRRWGSSFWPRIGQEVLVDFLEGDPDQPIIIGSVYNADQMPPYLGKGPDGKHADDNKVSGIKTNTSKGGSGFNELRFDDTADKQQIFIHAERDMDVRVKKDRHERIVGDQHLVVGDSGGSQYELIHKNRHQRVKGEHVEKIDGAMRLTVGGARDELTRGNMVETIKGDLDLTATGNRKTKVSGSDSLTVGQSYQEKVGMKRAVDAGQEIHLKAGMTVVIEAGMQLTLKGPGGFVDIGPAGVTIQGTMVLINSGGAAGAGTGSSPQEPKEAKAAEPTEPAEAEDSKTGQKSS